MQKTLFLYIFKDLVRVFLLASGAIAGIMSFGGLLRPLTQQGLDLGQVAQMLGYFMPAMTNYSWPIAVLFATTFVYGRLSADNELVACRAAGLNYLQILTPAVLIGIVVTLLSVAFLCFVVPRSFLAAERVVYSNLAKLVAGEIERTQRIRLDAGGQQTTIFARRAEVLDPDDTRPRDQGVELTDVTIVSYLKADGLPKVPTEFYLAERATAVISMPAADSDGDVMLRAFLTNGQKVPRLPTALAPTRASDANADPDAEPPTPLRPHERNQSRAVIGSSSAGPFVLQSPVRETTKFMDIYRLLDLRQHPEQSRKVAKTLANLTKIDQTRAFIRELGNRLKRGETITLAGTDVGSTVRYTIGPLARDQVNAWNEKLYLVAGTLDAPGVPVASDAFTGKAREVTVIPTPDSSASTVYAKVELRDAVLESGGQTTPTQSKEFHVSVPMSEPLQELARRSAMDFLAAGTDAYGKDRAKQLVTDVTRQKNQIESELHARVSFACSCFLLAIVGAIIGMMTRSGNFVSAFAVSVGPALLAIVLIVTGQHIAESMPRVTLSGAVAQMSVHSPLKLGLTVMWAGCASVLAMGVALYLRLSRT